MFISTHLSVLKAPTDAFFLFVDKKSKQALLFFNKILTLGSDNVFSLLSLNRIFVQDFQ